MASCLKCHVRLNYIIRDNIRILYCPTCLKEYVVRDGELFDLVKEKPKPAHETNTQTGTRYKRTK